MRKGKQRFSVVCVYNNIDILEKYLLESLKNQTCACETVLIDNRKGRFSSAAAAFNSVADRISGEYVIFSHQDISLCDPDTLARMYGLVKGFGKDVVAGVAGKKQGSWTISCITHGAPPSFPGKSRAEKVEEVQTLDECMFIVSKKLLKKHRFDEITCSGWHLYAVDYCLSVAGHAKVLVLPANGVHHRGGNSFDLGGYYDALKMVARKHRGNFKKIYTTCGDWPTNGMALSFRIGKHGIDRRLRKARIAVKELIKRWFSEFGAGSF